MVIFHLLVYKYIYFLLAGCCYALSFFPGLYNLLEDKPGKERQVGI